MYAIRSYYVTTTESTKEEIFKNHYKNELQAKLKKLDFVKNANVMYTKPEKSIWQDPNSDEDKGSAYVHIDSNKTRITSYNVCYTKLLREPTYAFSMWGGQTTDPEKVRMLMIEEINKMVLGSLSAIDCERIRKTHKGRFIKQLSYNFV